MKTLGPQPLRLLTHGRLIVCRDEDCRWLLANRGHLAVQVEARHSWQLNIEHQTVSSGRYAGIKCGFCRCKEDGLETAGPQHPFDCLAHASVILNYDDSSCFSRHSRLLTLLGNW